MAHASLWRQLITSSLVLALPSALAWAQAVPYPYLPPPVAYPDTIGAYQRSAQAVYDQRAAQLENQRREQELLAIKLENERAIAALRAEAVQALSPEQERFKAAIKYRRFRWPDFDEVAFAPGVRVTTGMIGFMAESRYAADIAYYLGKHQERSAEIAGMPLRSQAAAIADIEAKVSANSH
jgi:hypothetical protein